MQESMKSASAGVVGARAASLITGVGIASSNVTSFGVTGASSDTAGNVGMNSSPSSNEATKGVPGARLFTVIDIAEGFPAPDFIPVFEPNKTLTWRARTAAKIIDVVFIFSGISLLMKQRYANRQGRSLWNRPASITSRRTEDKNRSMVVGGLVFNSAGNHKFTIEINNSHKDLKTQITRIQSNK
jgi:hypothetical protein